MSSLRIIYLNNLNSFESVMQDLIESGNNGLSMIDENKEKIVVICLTTKTAIYVICPHQNDQMNFLISLLDRKDIKIYTADGLWISDLLKSNFGICMNGKIDLAAFHIQLKIMEHVQTKSGIDRDIDERYIIEKIEPEFLTCDQLVAEYQLNNSRAFNHGTNELNKQIQRKAMYVRDLADKMESKYRRLTHGPSKTIFSLATRANDSYKSSYDNSKINTFDELCTILSKCPKNDESS